MAFELGDYAIAFWLTVLLEVTVALAWGYRKRTEIAAVFWVNVFSHPLLHFVLWTMALFRTTPLSSSAILFLEGGVVLLEWRLLAYALPERSPRRLFLLALVMNAASYFWPFQP